MVVSCLPLIKGFCLGPAVLALKIVAAVALAVVILTAPAAPVADGEFFSASASSGLPVAGAGCALSPAVALLACCAVMAAGAGAG